MMKVLIAVLFTATLADKVTPVQKVIELMNNMVEKGTKEMQDEQVQFATFKTFCDNTVSAKQAAIAEATEQIEVLTADIEKYEAEAATAAKAVAGLESDINTWEGDTRAAQKVREIEHTDYVATHKDYTESIDALDEGIATLKKQAHDVKQAAASLVQISARPYTCPILCLARLGHPSALLRLLLHLILDHILSKPLIPIIDELLVVKLLHRLSPISIFCFAIEKWRERQAQEEGSNVGLGPKELLFEECSHRRRTWTRAASGNTINAQRSGQPPRGIS